MAETYTLEDLQDLSQEELQELVIETQNGYNQLKSSSDRWVNKLLEEKRELEKAVELVIKDENQLELIRESDPELAEKVASRLKWKISEKWATKEDMEKIVEKAMLKKTINSKISKISSQLWDLWEKFKEEFEGLTSGKELTEDNLEKYLKATLSIVSADWGVDVSLIKSGSLWTSTRWTASTQSKEEVDKRIEFARSL